MILLYIDINPILYINIHVGAPNIIPVFFNLIYSTKLCSHTYNLKYLYILDAFGVKFKKKNRYREKSCFNMRQI